MGLPVVGDNIYGSAPRTGGPVLHLHSREVVVPIYKNKDADLRHRAGASHMAEAGGVRLEAPNLIATTNQRRASKAST